MTDKLEYIPPPKQKLKYIPPPNKNGLVKKPLITYFDKFKELEVSPKLKNNIKVKPIDEEHIKLDIYKPKITEEEEVKLKNDLKVKKFRKVKAEGVKEFLLLFGIKDRPIKETDNINYYQFRLKNQNPTTLMITNWRKELGEKPTPLELKIENAKNNVKLDPNYSKSDFIKAYKEKMGKKDYKDDIDKDYKSKEEALLSNPNIKDKGKKLEALRANKEKINKNIVEIKPVEDIQNIVKKKMVDKGIDFDFDDTHIEKKTKKPIKIVEDKGVNTDPIEETFKEIVKTMGTQVPINPPAQKKGGKGETPPKEDKSIDTEEFNKYLTEKSEEVLKKLKTKIEKEKEKEVKLNKGLDTSDLIETIKEINKEVDKIKQKEKSKKEKAELRKSLTKKVKDKMDQILEDVNEQKEKGEKLVDKQETGVEANMIKIFNDNFLVKGDVKREAVLKNMEDLTGKIDHIINTLKGHGVDKRKVLNKESKVFFNENVIPVLQKDFNIDYEQLLSLFNKNTNQSLQYLNITLLKKTIKEFLKDKEHLEK